MNKIKKLQIDPFGLCNAKCWFCPVKYRPQPKEGMQIMPLSLMEKIFSQMIEERSDPDGIVHSSFDLFLTAHYNEILLYKHFDGMLELSRKYGLKTFVLSNGVALSKQKVDLIKEYPDVVTHIGLNIPAFEKEVWAKRSGFNPDLFDRLISNLQYATNELSYLKDQFQIHVNGIDSTSFESFLTKEKDFDSLEMNLHKITGEHNRQFHLARIMFPKTVVNKSGLMDRAGTINHIMSNENFLSNRIADKKVIGCNNWGNRATEWLHVNSKGDTFLCCNDYDFEYVFGNLQEDSLRKVWLSERRKEVISKAFDNICRKCTSAVT